MPEYLAPGVFVEEIDTGNKPIEGVSTSVAAFVGLTLPNRFADGAATPPPNASSSASATG